MQKKTSKRILCLLLTLLTVLPLIVATGIFTASAATETFNVVAKVSGSITYKGKNYATGATNQTQTFGLSAGFLLQSSVSGDTYWGTCINSGYKDPPLKTTYSKKMGVTGTFTDGYNNLNGGRSGAHYSVDKDSSWGTARTIDATFVFACFYYANKYKDTEFSMLDVNRCELQEAIAIAYRSEWDTRMIKYGYGATTGTGTWNDATKTWTPNTNVNNWVPDTTHFAGVTDGDSTHVAIVDAASAILKYAISDPDGVRKNVQATDNGTRLVYTDAHGGVNEMFAIEGPDNPRSSNPYQHLLLFRGPDPTSYSIRVEKVDVNGNILPGATFALYQKNANGTYQLYSTKRATTGVAEWDYLELTDYYIEETVAPPGYERWTGKAYVTKEQLAEEETVTVQVENMQEDTATWTPLAAKELVGDDLKNKQFTFVLEQRKSNSDWPVIQTVQNNEDGSIPFEPVEFSEIGNYQFRIREVKGSDSSIVYDTSVFNVTVLVSRNSKGELYVRERSSVGERVFTNWPKGAIGVKKVDQNGRPLAGVKFQIWLDPDCEWEYVASMTTDDEGIATHGVNNQGKYTLVPGKIYYVKEVSAPPGYIVDPTVYPVTVVEKTLTYANDGIPIVNESSATGSWKPDVVKIFEGGVLTDGQFEFELWQDSYTSGSPLQTVTNTAEGIIPFEEIEYTTADIGKTYTYYVKEGSKSVQGVVQADSHVVKYTVTISYSGTGDELTIEETREGDSTFKNRSWDSIYGAVGVKKVDQNGKPVKGVTFEVWNDMGVLMQKITTDETGIATYGVGSDGEYTLLAGVKYNLREVSAPPGYIMDSRWYDVTVVAGEITYVNNGEPIENVFSTCSWTPTARKVLIGGNVMMFSTSFTFVLENEDGKELQRVSQIYIDGSIPFDTIEYTIDDVGTHVYTIREIAGDGPFIYDDHIITYTVTVKNTDSGLIVEEDVEGDTTFRNEYSLFGAIGVKKVDKDGKPLAGVTFAVYYWEDFTQTLATITTDETGTAVYGMFYGEYSLVHGEVYALKEISAPEGYVVDGTWYEVTVVAGQITYINNGEPIVNEAPTGSWTPKADKVLAGRELKKGEFTFVLEKDGVELQRVTNLADGTIPFTAIQYTASDIDMTYTYTVRELRGSDAVIYDGHTVTYTVTISYSGTGSELIVEETVEGSTTFTNYVPTGSWTPEANKVLVGRELKKGEFTFVLERNGVELQRVTNLADGTIPFAAVQYTASDIDMTYTYTVREVRGSDNIFYDEHTVTYTVKISYPGTGTELTIEKTVEGSTTFTNYIPTGSWTPEVNKVLVGRVLKDGEFTFVLEKDGVELQRVTNLADGTIPFLALKYDSDDIGKHVYKIYEYAGTDPTVNYDAHAVTYTVTVSYSGTGRALTIEATVDGEATFTNYVPTITWVPKFQKHLTGAKLKEGMFYFQMSYADGDDELDKQTVTNNADGSIVFGSITYTKEDAGKSFVYLVKETGCSELVDFDYTQIDPTQEGLYIRVTVYNSGYGQLYLTWNVNWHVPTFVDSQEINSEDKLNALLASDFAFENCAAASYAPTVQKDYDGEMQGGEFTFVMEENGVELQRVTNNADGSVVFDPIEFRLYSYQMAGSLLEADRNAKYDMSATMHTLTIREIPGDDPDIIYDPTVYTFTVEFRVSDDDIEVIVTPEPADGVFTFTNKDRIQPITWTPEANKELVGRDLKEGEFTFVLEEDGVELQRVTNNADGSIPFTALTYTSEDTGTYTYTIREVRGIDNIFYDSHVVTYTVKVDLNDTEKALTLEADVEGETTFTNRQPGKIEILKTDPYGNVLAGAEFLLEWSEDKETWSPVIATTELVKGGCTTPGLTDGKLITDDDGRAVFDGLEPTLYYRLTETKAPEGMQLLADYAYKGLLGDHSDLTVSLHVVNTPTFKIPETGDRGFGYLIFVIPMVCCIGAAAVLAVTGKRKTV